jgi:type III secretory pathway component EscS
MTMVGRRAPQVESVHSDICADEPERAWRSLSTVALICALGLLTINLAFWAGRAGHGGPAASAAYWLGQLLVVAPIAVRLLSRRAPDHTESLGLVGLLVIVEYAVKFSYSPLMFTFPDELEHWRSTQDILATGNLFTINYSLPISPDYPGLENVTAAFSSITGLSVFASGTVIIGVAHLLFVALLYAFFHKVSGSTRVAGIGALIYAMSPHFAFFDSMFIYQVLALPFLVLGMYAVLALTQLRESPQSQPRRARTGWWVVLVLSVMTVTVTHHVTTYVLAGLLALFAAVTAVQSHWRALRVPLLAFVLTMAATAAWLRLAAPTTLSYLAPNITSLAGNLFGGPKAQKSSLPTGPLVNHVLVLILVIAMAVLLLYGAVRIWRSGQRSAGAITLLIASLAFYPVLMMRLVSANGAERAGRAFTFVFIPAAYVVAVGVAHLIRAPHHSTARGRARAVIAVGLAVTMFAGSLAGGWPPYWEMLPGPFQVGGFERSVSPQGIAGANWALSALGTGNRFGVDISNAALLAAYGKQDTVRDASSLYYSASIGPAERDFLASSSLRYLFVDRRLALSLPVSGSYFPVDPNISNLKGPIPLKNLDKYDGMRGVDRLYDSGDVVIYDLRGLSLAK